jgi:hypothetical protein
MSQANIPQVTCVTPGTGALVVRSFRAPQFVVAAALLLLSAVGLNAATEFLKLHFKKQPVALRIPLENLPARLGPWVQVSRDQPLAEDTEEVLGTRKYIFRDFVDSRKVTAEQIAAFTDQDIRKRGELLAAIRDRDPTAVVNMSVTYYTGMVDTVAHIPDRCYIADGYVPEDADYPVWKLGGEDPRQLQVRFINFADSLGNQRRKASKSVAYFFQCNGGYEADPLGVRQRLQNLVEKHGYYCKIELMTLVDDKSLSSATMTDFLTYALPELEKMLPDWKAVQAGTAPQETPDMPVTAVATAGPPATRPAGEKVGAEKVGGGKSGGDH